MVFTLGPKGNIEFLAWLGVGNEGGYIVAEGTPEPVRRCPLCIGRAAAN